MSEARAVKRLPKRLRKHFYEACRMFGVSPSVRSFLRCRVAARLMGHPGGTTKDTTFECFDCLAIERELSSGEVGQDSD